MRHQRNRLIELNIGEHQTRSNVLRGMLTNLIRHGRVTTTNKKAKALKAYADNFFARLVGYAKNKENTDATRESIRFIKSIIFTEEEGKKVMSDILPKYIASNNNGGYVSYFKLGFRKGDAAEKLMVTL